MALNMSLFIIDRAETYALPGGSNTEAAAKCELQEEREPVNDQTLLYFKNSLHLQHLKCKLIMSLSRIYLFLLNVVLI